jgi:3-isopropylmalate dehydrogenase
MRFKVAVLPGDGIGPEVAGEGVKVLERVGERFGYNFNLHYGLVGGVAIAETGSALPPETFHMCQECNAILLGAVGDPRFDDPKREIHPEDGLLGLRKGLSLFANLRPINIFPSLIDSSTLKPEVIKDVDLIIVRELTGGLYFGQPKRRWQEEGKRKAVDTLSYSEEEIRRILKVGFEIARGRRRKLSSVDKANVLQSSRLWREMAMEVAMEYPDVELEHILVDACAMRLIRRPSEFDVIVTENMFGDIITDEASMLSSSLGMLPSASISGLPQGRTLGMYEPVHGSSPRRAGKDMANPIATILSVALMLRYSLGLKEEALAVERAVQSTLEEGYRTYDIMDEGKTKVGTKEMGDLIAQRI